MCLQALSLCLAALLPSPPRSHLIADPPSLRDHTSTALSTIDSRLCTVPFAHSKEKAVEVGEERSQLKL